ncbi:MAG: hypothetical protein GY849_18970, partial [Deltaproteobacteria bacterium]|nr:hypothetical protein [Deltaproteobacteria bacterium]
GTSQLSNVPYALHTKTTEAAKAITYTMSGTSQLLSVPYALYAKTAGAVADGITETALSDSIAQVRSEIPDVSGLLTSETDPTFTSSQAFNITASDITNIDLNTAKVSAATSTQTGDMQYWDGTAWVTVPVGNNGELLILVGGVPTWAGISGPTAFAGNDALVCAESDYVIQGATVTNQASYAWTSSGSAGTLTNDVNN